MAGKISEMSAAGTLTGAELLEVVQSGNTRRSTAAAIAALALVDGDKGDVTVSASGATWTVDNDAITNAKLANVNTQTIKGRTTASSGDPEDLTAAQASTLLQQDGLDDEACGFRGIPVVDFSAATNIIAAHHGKTLRHPSSDANARTLTIQANGTLALPVGFTFSVVNETSQAVTIAITSDTLTLAGDGSAAPLTLAQYGMAVVTKLTSTTWYASGTGLTA